MEVHLDSVHLDESVLDACVLGGVRDITANLAYTPRTTPPAHGIHTARKIKMFL